GASNKNGTYSIITTLNDIAKFEVKVDKFSFNETRYLNRYIDYGYYKTNRSQIQKLFRESNNPLSVITNEDNSEYVTVQDSMDYSYTISVKDFKGNTLRVIVPIKGKKLEILNPKEIKETEDFIFADHATSLTKGKFSVYIPANSLYEDTYLNIKTDGDTLIF